MATVTIIQAASLTKAPKAPTQPRAKITDGTTTLNLPWAPVGSSIGGWSSTFDTTPRPGRRPLVQHTGGNLPTLGLAFTLIHRDWTQSIEPWLSQLYTLAARGWRVKVLNLSPKEVGPWRITACDVNVTQRVPGTNDAARAEVSLTLTYAVDANPKLGPVHGGKKKPKATGKSKGSKTSATRHYTIKSGDSLSAIAEKFYGEPGKWPQIAKANKITHPRKLKVGRKITIPPEK